MVAIKPPIPLVNTGRQNRMPTTPWLRGAPGGEPLGRWRSPHTPSGREIRDHAATHIMNACVSVRPMAARLLADCSRQYCCDGARTSRIFAQEQRRRQTDETRAWRVGGQPYDAVLLPFRGQKYESPGENVRVHATNTYLLPPPLPRSSQQSSVCGAFTRTHLWTCYTNVLPHCTCFRRRC